MTTAGVQKTTWVRLINPSLIATRPNIAAPIATAWLVKYAASTQRAPPCQNANSADVMPIVTIQRIHQDRVGDHWGVEPHTLFVMNHRPTAARRIRLAPRYRAAEPFWLNVRDEVPLVFVIEKSSLPKPRLSRANTLSRIGANKKGCCTDVADSIPDSPAEEYRNAWTAIGVASGEEGIEILCSKGAGVRFCLLDMNMPGLGGEETLRAMRELRSDFPILLTSGYSEDSVTRLFTLERTEFLAKPYSIAALSIQLGKLLEADQAVT
jgi:CheY-like chemotaxis protein